MMKKIIFLVLFSGFSVAYAQTGIKVVDSAIAARKNAPAKPKLQTSDNGAWSPEKDKIFGSQKEFKLEQEMANQVENSYFDKFIGFKEAYANGLSMYIQSQFGYVLDTKTPSNVYLLTLPGRVTGTAKRPFIKAVFGVNEKGRIVSVVITGDSNDIEKLYENYWPIRDPVGLGSSTTRGFVKHLFGDRITLRLDGESPTITVTKDNEGGMTINPPTSN